MGRKPGQRDWFDTYAEERIKEIRRVDPRLANHEELCFALEKIQRTYSADEAIQDLCEQLRRAIQNRWNLKEFERRRRLES